MKVGDPGWQEHFAKRRQEILVLLDQGMTLRAVANRYGVSHSRIRSIRCRSEWIAAGRPTNDDYRRWEAAGRPTGEIWR